MKQVTYQRECSKDVYKYQKGHLYINENNAIVICNKNDSCILHGVLLLSSVSDDNIGDRVEVENYEEFHGTVTLYN